MLCRRCTNRIISSLYPNRALTTTTFRLRPENPPAATSTSAAQPFSTPLTPSPSNTPNISKESAAKDAKASRSSVPAGAPLRGLSYIKGADAVLAREDSSYPPWLWTLLDPSSKDALSSASGESEGDAFAKSKKQRKIAAKAAKAKSLNSHAAVHTVRVPLHEQSIDLPAEGREATEARGQLRESMRDARRRKIKEQNFLKGMR